MIPFIAGTCVHRVVGLPAELSEYSQTSVLLILSKLTLTIRLGANQGEDGWVSVWVDSKGSNTNEKYLPEGCTSLWNESQRMLNFHGLKIGSQVFVTYNFELTTYTNNTEVWIRTLFPRSTTEISQFVASLKYQYVYNMYVTQHFFIEDNSMWSSGAVPQIRTDYDSSVLMNSIYVSVI